MKLTEAQIWQCNNDGDGGVHICLDHQNVVDFARAIEREIGFARVELWLKRINDAVLSEREACAKLAREIGNATEPDDWALDKCEEIETAIRARGTT